MGSNRKIYNCKQCGKPVIPWKAKYLEFRHICKSCKRKTAHNNLDAAIKARQENARKKNERQKKEDKEKKTL